MAESKVDPAEPKGPATAPRTGPTSAIDRYFSITERGSSVVT